MTEKCKSKRSSAAQATKEEHSAERQCWRECKKRAFDGGRGRKKKRERERDRMSMAKQEKRMDARNTSWDYEVFVVCIDKPENEVFSLHSVLPLSFFNCSPNKTQWFSFWIFVIYAELFRLNIRWRLFFSHSDAGWDRLCPKPCPNFNSIFHSVVYIHGVYYTHTTSENKTFATRLTLP